MNLKDSCRIGSVLVADDEPLKRITLQAALREAGWEVFTAADGLEAVRIVESQSVDAAVVDLKMPGLDGLELLERIRALQPGTPVIVMTAYGSIETAVEAMRRGAVDFVTKPFHNEALLQKLQKFIRLVPAPQRPAEKVVRFGRIATCDPQMAKVLNQAERLANATLPIAICGASGVGRKTLGAAIHQASRPEASLIVLDTSILPGEQIQQRLVALADEAVGGETILVADAQLLTSEQQERLAGLIAAWGPTDTGRSIRFVITLSDRPERLNEANLLNEQLAGLLQAGVLYVPCLSDRRADIALLTDEILKQVCPQQAPPVSPAAMQMLCAYDWPGNIKQLWIVIERAAKLAMPGSIEPRHLPILRPTEPSVGLAGRAASGPLRLQETLNEVERELIRSALRQARHNQAKAAELLGLPRTTLRDKLLKHGLTNKGVPKGDADGFSS